VKEFWIEIESSASKEEKERLMESSAALCDVVLVNESDKDLSKAYGAKKVASTRDADILVLETVNKEEIAKIKQRPGMVCVKVDIKGRADEELAVDAANAGADYIIISCSDWKIIPLENLISKIHGRSKLLFMASGVNEAKVALETLELGADGIVLKSRDLSEISLTSNLVKAVHSMIELSTVKVTNLKPLSTGARVCVDTCDLMEPGEGILVGCQSSGLFLVQAEIHGSEYVESRPFRVNAGPVSLYVLTPDNKTKYLSELKAGDEVVVSNREGRIRLANVGRVKIERRPLMLIEAEGQGRKLKTIVQNAETIRLVTKAGSKSVVDLKVGDEVLARIEHGGRHFGTLVKEESILER